MSKPPRLESEAIVTKQPCPGCASSDAFAYYTDGHGFCFAEGKHYSPAALRKLGYEMAKADLGQHGADPSGRVPAVLHSGDAHRGSSPADPALANFLVGTKHLLITTRGLTLATCKRWDYRIRKHPTKHTFQQIATLPDKHGNPVALHVRDTGRDGTEKEFFWVGQQNKVASIWGQHLWPSGGGNRPKSRLLVCEGEIDTLTVSQALDHKWPVVGITTGASNAHKEIAQNLEWVNSFESVIFMFDMDEPGRNAALECAQLLPPGKAYIASLTEHDCNDLLTKGKAAEITQASWNAKPYRPDGIVDAQNSPELDAECLRPVTLGLPWPWKFMTNMTFGRRRGEVYVFGAGAGVGKTDLLSEIEASILVGRTKYGAVFEPAHLGIFGFEAGAARTKNAIAGKLFNKRFHIPNIPGEPPLWEPGELAEALRFINEDVRRAGGRLFINNWFGKADWTAVVSRMRFLNKAEGVRDFVVDPISALTAGDEEERSTIDGMILEASKLAVELDSTIYLVSHLTAPKQGPSHEEGGQVRPHQFRGSNAINMFCTYSFGLERNKFADDPMEQIKATLRCTKDRYTGNSDNATGLLYFDRFSGTLDVENTGEIVAE